VLLAGLLTHASSDLSCLPRELNLVKPRVVITSDHGNYNWWRELRTTFGSQSIGPAVTLKDSHDTMHEAVV
jgi:hypothetical protein